MRTLFLHIGHGKTGSTWIQSSLRLSRAALAAQGIDYPSEPGGETDDPARITSGNGSGLLASAETLDARLSAIAAAPGRSVLFSSEYLFGEIASGDAPDVLVETARRHGLERLSILLFIRDPLGLAASGWQQGVKREGLVEDIEDHFAKSRMPEQVADLLDRLETVGGIEVAVRNYSRCRDRLLAETAAWLGVPEEVLAPPPAVRVNRSMTRAELALQKALNRRLGPSGRLLSDPLCERLPDVEPEDVRPPAAVQAATWERLLPAIERVNARLPEAQRYRRDLREPVADPDHLVFSPAQIALIGERLGGEIARQREEIARQRTETARLRADPAAALGLRRVLRSALRRAVRRLLRPGRRAAEDRG